MANADYDRSADSMIAICRNLCTVILGFLILANGKFSIITIKSGTQEKFST